MAGPRHEDTMKAARLLHQAGSFHIAGLSGDTRPVIVSRKDQSRELPVLRFVLPCRRGYWRSADLTGDTDG